MCRNGDRPQFYYRIRTEQAYVDWIRRFVRHFGKQHPTRNGADNVETFLPHLNARRETETRLEWWLPRNLANRHIAHFPLTAAFRIRCDLLRANRWKAGKKDIYTNTSLRPIIHAHLQAYGSKVVY